MNVLVTDRFDRDAFEKLASSVTLKQARSPDLGQDDLSQTEGLVIRSRTKINESLLHRAPKLRAVITSTSGFDHIDLEACARYKVSVMYTPNANAASATELTWGLMLAAARKIVSANTMVAHGDWNREPLMGTQLAGKIYGVVGFGRIGSRVARIAEAFGMTVRVCDPYKNGQPFESVFREADFISFHVPATAQTHHMLTPDLFAQAKPGLVFVNTSRGSIVSDQTLIDALEKGQIAAAGLDVFETEPLLATSKLLTFENVVLTPHIGATTSDAFKAASLEAAEKMIAFAQHGTATDSLPGNEPWMSSR